MCVCIYIKFSTCADRRGFCVTRDTAGNLCSQSTFFSTSRSAGYYAGQTAKTYSFLKLYF